LKERSERLYTRLIEGSKKAGQRHGQDSQGKEADRDDEDRGPAPPESG